MQRTALCKPRPTANTGYWAFLKPQGFKDPNKWVLGSKCYSINGIRALKPYYVGPWILRVNLTLLHAAEGDAGRVSFEQLAG